MQVTTKFNLDQAVWKMHNNLPIQVVISSIEIFHVNTNQKYIKYNARDHLNPVTWLDHRDLYETSLFKTKEELLKSVFKGIVSCKGVDCSAIDGMNHSLECIEEHDIATTAEVPGFEGTLLALHKLNVS